MAYDSATGNLTRRVDGTHGSTQKMHSTRADLQGNVVVGGFYNELLTGVAYENYDLLRTDMLRCKNVKGFNIYHPVYGTLDTCNTVSASDSDQRIQQESYAAYVQNALYLTDNWIAVAGVRYQYNTQYAGKGRPFNVNTDSRDEKWTPKAGLVYKVTPNVSVRQRRPVVYAAVVDRQLYRRAAAGRVHLLRSGRQIRPVKRHYRQYRAV